MSNERAKNASDFQQGYRAAMRDVLAILNDLTIGTAELAIREFVETGLSIR
jgi:hypothetical protein